MRERLQIAEQEYREAESARLVKSMTLSSEAQRLEAELGDSAPAEIDDFIREMERLFDHDRQQIRAIENPEKQNALTLGRPTIAQTNVRAVHARIRAIREAIEAAAALRFELGVPSDLGTRLDALRKGVEAIDIGRFERVDTPPTVLPTVAEGPRYGAV